MVFIFLIEYNLYIIFISLFWNFYIYVMYKYVEYFMEKKIIEGFYGDVIYILYSKFLYFN